MKRAKNWSKYETIRQQVASANANYETALARLADGKFAEAEKLLREAVVLLQDMPPLSIRSGRCCWIVDRPRKRWNSWTALSK